ncbi:MAG: hypothetical protein R3277_05590 [Brumimicrobium sp.]|nr:hypothetical protein [Brumimicrobium sp.]
MLKINQLFIATLIVFTASLSMAQCPQPGQVLRADYKDGWGENSQSKTGTLRPGDTYEMNFIAQRGLKYRITILSGTGPFTDQNVEFQLVGSEVKKVEQNGKMVYKRQEVVLYDSANKQGDEKMSFSSPKTQKLTLRIKLNGAEDSKAVQCVVVFVETKRELEVGF